MNGPDHSCTTKMLDNPVEVLMFLSRTLHSFFPEGKVSFLLLHPSVSTLKQRFSYFRRSRGASDNLSCSSNSLTIPSLSLNHAAPLHAVETARRSRFLESGSEWLKGP